MSKVKKEKDILERLFGTRVKQYASAKMAVGIKETLTRTARLFEERNIDINMHVIYVDYSEHWELC